MVPESGELYVIESRDLFPLGYSGGPLSAGCPNGPNDGLLNLFSKKPKGVLDAPILLSEYFELHASAEYLKVREFGT